MGRFTGDGALTFTPVVGEAFSEAVKPKGDRIILWVKVVDMGDATTIKPGIKAKKPGSADTADAFEVWEASALVATGTAVYVLGRNVGAGGAYTAEIETVIPPDIYVTLDADDVGYDVEVLVINPPK